MSFWSSLSGSSKDPKETPAERSSSAADRREMPVAGPSSYSTASPRMTNEDSRISVVATSRNASRTPETASLPFESHQTSDSDSHTKPLNDRPSQLLTHRLTASAMPPSSSPTSATFLTLCQPNEAALTVTKGFLSFVALGVIGGASAGLASGKDPVVAGYRTGVNAGVGGIGFWGFREYVISPLLLLTIPDSPLSTTLAQYQRRRDLILLNHSPADQDHSKAQLLEGRTPKEIRHENLLDSGLAGGLTGAAMSAFIRGGRRLPSAFLTAGLIASSLQYAFNSVRAGRLSLLANKAVKEQREIDAQSKAAEIVDPTREPPAPTLLEKTMSFLKQYSPVRKISDEEYLDILHRQKAELEKSLMESPHTGVSENMRQMDVVSRKIDQVQSKLHARENDGAVS